MFSPRFLQVSEAADEPPEILVEEPEKAEMYKRVGLKPGGEKSTQNLAEIHWQY